MGWCWRRCLSEVDEDGDDNYPLCWVFFGILLGGPFFLSSLSRDDDDDNEDEWETYMSTQNGIFSFSSYIYLVQRTDFFFLLSHPRSYTCKDSYLMLALLLLL